MTKTTALAFALAAVVLVPSAVHGQPAARPLVTKHLVREEGRRFRVPLMDAYISTPIKPDELVAAIHAITGSFGAQV